MKRTILYKLTGVFMATVAVWFVASATYNPNPQPPDSSDSMVQNNDTTQSTDLKYPIKESSGNPYLEKEEGGVIDLNPPSNMDYTYEYDPNTQQITVYRKIGGIDVRLPYTMTLNQYLDLDTRSSMSDYWHERQQLESGQYSGSSLLNQKFRFGGEAFNSIFGGNLIDIKLQGTAELKIGFSTTNVENPTLQERLRKTTTFDFEENIQMNINGNIGDKMQVGINYNTQALFDFENQVKLEYTGDEDEIIQKIEAGNVSLPLPGTLITGSQSLFGIKTEMKFGKLTMTSVFSQQKGESKVINVEGGASKQEFEISADEYDENRHFFLAHTFRDRYDEALASLPIITSGFNIEEIEIWVTNKQGNFDDARNIIAFLDLAEDSTHRRNTSSWIESTPTRLEPNNANNSLYNDMNDAYGNIRDINNATSTLRSIPNFSSGVDYEKVESARLLRSSEYTVNRKLGYISLNSALQSDEVLGVAYKYTYNGERFKVGELTTDGIAGDSALYVKLLKGTNLNPDIETWDLMMKNIYSLNAYQVDRDDFTFNVVMRNDSTGTDINYFNQGAEAPQGINREILLTVMNLDQLNSNSDISPDGRFDFLNGITINAQTGRVIFPVVEPFGEHLESKLANDPNSTALTDKYVYHDLYEKTKTQAAQNSDKNRFKLVGSYKSSGGGEISLNAMNIPRGSVVVTAGGIKLIENADYTVDYSMGRVKIINDAYLTSGTPIKVALESQSLYNLQTKTMMGTHLDYQANDKLNIGGTLMHLRERPLTQKVSMGNEPIANTIWGFNGSYNTETQGLTDLIDKLPLVVATKPSSITFEGEVASLMPGHPNIIDDEGTAYIDDFEGAETSYDMKYFTSWRLASAPSGLISNTSGDSLSSGFGRAKIAWYNIDPLFNRNTNQTPSHIKNDTSQLSNHFVREVYEKELFPEKDLSYGQQSNITVLNLAYYPSERGPYNYDAQNVNPNGSLSDPESRWGGIMRKIDNSDFESANIEYIEFWLMDPFVYNDDLDQGGDLYFNLGEISEDILPDTRKSFEQGLPTPDNNVRLDQTKWGYVSTETSTVNGFDSDPKNLFAQDIGLDGMNDQKEKEFFNNYLTTLANNGVDTTGIDPSSDDYHYYRGSDYDNEKVSVLDRYKNYNNHEGNSVPSEYSPESYSTASYSTPDIEDINLDNTLNETESYYEYKVSLRPDNMQVGQNFITNMVERNVELKNNTTAPIKWYHFRIPISTAAVDTIGSINDFSSIRFLRMYMHDFQNPAVLRFAALDLVRSDWRVYKNDLTEESEDITPIINDYSNLEISAVNIEEDSDRDPINYVLPPGVDRVIDPSNPQVAELNEQSLSLKVTDLGYYDTKAVYKNTSVDMRPYKRIKMFVHAEALKGENLENSTLTAFIRLGSDAKNNYYEYEIPLSVTPEGQTDDKTLVWPEDNVMDIPLDLFTSLKLKRNDAKRQQGSTLTFSDVYDDEDPDNTANKVKIKGNPTLADVEVIMLGVRNKRSEDASGEIWFNELRLSDFEEDGGWAANASVRVNLSDLGSVSMAGMMSTKGFGSIDQSVNERSQEDFYQYDIATNLEAGKLLGPQSRVSIPFYYGYSKSVSTPKYNPLDDDVLLDVALDNAGSQPERDSILEVSQAVTNHKSVNLSNVRLLPKANKKPTPVSLSNISTSYSYSETNMKDINTEFSKDKNYQGSINYNYSIKTRPVEPFKKIVKSNTFALIRDFNFYYLPTQVSYSLQFRRDYSETQLRNISNPDYVIPISVSKDFSLNQSFNLKYDLSRSLKLDFKSSTNARVDEPDGAVNRELYPDEYEVWKDSVIQNILSLGRTTNYNHAASASYQVPINKIPLMDWASLSTRYNGTYSWATGPMLESGEISPIGNTIKNTNKIQVNSTLNLKRLYTKLPYFKNLEQKYNARSNRRRSSSNNTRTERYTKDNIKLNEGDAITINHKLKTIDVKVRIFDANGRPVDGKTDVINPNKISFTPSASHEKARVSITGTVEDKNTPFTIIKDYTSLLLTGVKNISIQYSENNGTILPGYMEGSNWTSSSFSEPGLPFVFGIQDRDFAIKAADNNWLSDDSNQSNPYVMTHSDNFSIKLTFQPFKDFKIDLSADRKFQKNITEYYIFDDSNNRFEARNTYYRGNFSMSYNIFRTSFLAVNKNKSYESEAYNKFLSYRSIISDRLEQQRKELDASGNYSDGGYGNNSQDVLIPAFLAAYSGTSPHKVFLTPFPGLQYIQPNWRLTYDGLSKVKWFQKSMKSFSISHNYKSSYNVGSYTTNFESAQEIRDELTWRSDQQNNFIPAYAINSVSLREQFSPLIQFNVTWQNSLTTRAEIKKTRTLNLNLTNSQLIENYTNEYVIGLGYRLNELNLNIGNNALSSDVNFRFDFSIRENFALIRKFSDNVDQLTSGSKVMAIKFTADYALSDRFTMQLYYDRNVNKPLITTSYPTSNSNFGLSFQFSLTQ